MAGRLEGKVAIITGAGTGIGEAVAQKFAREGARLILTGLEGDPVTEVARSIGEQGGEAEAFVGNMADEATARACVEAVVERFGRLDILVNNAAEQHLRASLAEIDAASLDRIFHSNVFGYFFLTKAALPHLKEGAAIINTTSITAYQGHPSLIDYSATRGAIVAFTRSLSQSLVGQGIRVNAVAPGPIWTPLIPASFTEEKVSKHGQSAPMGRVGQPNEVAPCYVFLASDEASYITGQVLHPNGGTIVNG